MRRRFWIGAALAAGMANFASAASITVNTAADDFNSVNTGCSLREAIQSANNNANFGGCNAVGSYGADDIFLPTISGGSFFTLTRIGTDDSNSSGDLDIAGSVTIHGVSAANSRIRGNTGDPDSSRHRLMHVISGTVTLDDLTLRDGLEDGAGAGGGLRTEPGSTTTLNRVTVAFNIAGGNAGGILNRGTMTLNESLVSQNQTLEASLGGGGIFSSPDSRLTLFDSRVLDNTVNCSNAGEADGGGIYSDTGTFLILDNSVVDGNLADGRHGLGDSNAHGGGIYALGNVFVTRSSVTHNEAVGNSVSGGGLDTFGIGQFSVDLSVISFNLARGTAGGAGGGGISGSPAITDSVISSNEARSNQSASGGGLSGGGRRIVRSTIANNFLGGNAVGEGGGMRVGSTEIVNSTLFGNQSTGFGGAIAFTGSQSTADELRIFSSTIAGNTAVAGGGVTVVSGVADIRIANTVLAGNSDSSGASDCDGDLASDGFNLVQSAAGCNVATTTGDQVGVGAGLAAVANNGGPTAGSSLGIVSAMQTRAPLPGSLLIDAGNTNGCRDETNAFLTTDQIGRNRSIDGPDAGTSARCDIGAIEFIDPDIIFANGFE